MAVQVLVFDKSMRLLDELAPEIEYVAWRLNGVGKMVIRLPYSDPKCTPTNLALGNRVLVRFDSGLPDWGGVLNLPPKETSTGVEVNVYSGEKFFDWRVTPKGRYFDQQMAGYIYQKLISEENGVYPTGLEVGDIYMGGDPRTLEFHYHDLWARVQKLHTLTGFDFAVMPEYENGQLSFKAHWYLSRGQDRSTRVALVEGLNVSEIVLDWNGPLANRIYLVGEGSTWGDERKTGFAEDTDSIAAYGLREYAEMQSGVVEQATLDANAAALLAARKEPRSSYTLGRVLNKAPGLFAAYDVGDTVRLEGHFDAGAWGQIDDEVRVISREWHPDGTCTLEVI